MVRLHSIAKTWLFWAIILPSMLTGPQALAVDSGEVNALSVANVAFGATNVISGGVDCVCNASSSSCPLVPWAPCLMLPLSLATLLSSLSTMANNADSAEHFDPNQTTLGLTTTTGGSGSTGGTTVLATNDGQVLPNKKTPMQWGEFCTKTPDFCNDCAKGGDFANCKPEMVLPESVDRSAFNTPELAEALAAFDKAADFVNSNGASNSVEGAAHEDSAFASSEGGSSDPVYVKKAGGPGKLDRDGLGGASIWGMDMVDEKTGAKLTLWQRATRRYYGVPDMNRLNFLARAEFVRAKAIQHAKSNIKAPAPAKVAQGQSKDPRAPSADKSVPVVPTRQ